MPFASVPSTRATCGSLGEIAAAAFKSHKVSNTSIVLQMVPKELPGSSKVRLEFDRNKTGLVSR